MSPIVADGIAPHCTVCSSKICKGGNSSSGLNSRTNPLYAASSNSWESEEWLMCLCPQNGCFQGCRPVPPHSPFPIMLHPGCWHLHDHRFLQTLRNKYRAQVRKWSKRHWNLFHHQTMKWGLKTEARRTEGFTTALWRFHKITVLAGSTELAVSPTRLFPAPAAIAAVLTLIKSRAHKLNEMPHEY